MIERLRIEGFKAIGPLGIDLPLAPITLLLGENSVGKSSIFQALLAIQQSWATFAGIGELSPVGQFVDLGRFSSVQHRMGEFVYSRVKVEIVEDGRSVGFCWRAPTQERIPDQMATIVDPPLGWPARWRLRETVDRGALRSIRIDGLTFFAEELSAIGKVRLTLSIKSVTRWLIDHPDPLVSVAVEAGARFHWWVEPQDDGFQTPYVEYESDVSDKAGFAAINELCTLVQDEPKREGAIWSFASRALQRLPRLRRQLHNSAHIGGIRERGRRLYEVTVSDAPYSVGTSGSRIVDLLTHHPDALARTNRLLDTTKLNYHVTIETPPTQAQVCEVLLQDLRLGRGQGNLVGLPDVGTGISQILPFAVQVAVFGNRHRFDSDPLLLMEQPELHLHPLLQARLARLMASAVTLEVDEESDQTPGRPVQFLIETHSEHLVRALSVLVEQKELPKEAVSIIKLIRDDDGEVIATRMRMDDDGRFLDSWPGGFFSERETLLDGEIP